VAGGIFDGAADQANLRRQPHGRGTILGCIAVAIFQIGDNRQRRRFDDCPGIGQRLVAAYRAFGIAPAQRKGQPGAGGGQGMETERREHLCRPGIPGVGQHQQFGLLV